MVVDGLAQPEPADDPAGMKQIAVPDFEETEEITVRELMHR